MSRLSGLGSRSDWDRGAEIPTLIEVEDAGRDLPGTDPSGICKSFADGGLGLDFGESNVPNGTIHFIIPTSPSAQGGDRQGVSVDAAGAESSPVNWSNSFGPLPARI